MPNISTDNAHPVPILDARLTPSERAMRKTLLDLLVQRGRPVGLAELEGGDGLAAQDNAELVAALQAKGLLVRNANNEIAFVYPVSGLPTRHLVTLADGRFFYAMCAIDALGCAFEFAQDTSVTSSCSLCQDKLTVSLVGGRLGAADPPTIQVLHVDLEEYADWAANC